MNHVSKKDIKALARIIICKCTFRTMISHDTHPASNQALFNDMRQECSCILTEKLLNGEITPMEYNDTRNELADLLWKVFRKYIEAENAMNA